MTALAGEVRSATERPYIVYVSGQRSPWLDPGRSCLWHAHPVYELVYRPTGMGVASFADGHTIAFAPGSVLVYPPHLPHSDEHTEGGENIIVHFALRGEAPRAYTSYHYAPVVSEMVAQELQMLSNPRPLISPLEQGEWDARMTAVVLHLWQAGAPEGSNALPTADRYVEDACRYMLAHYAAIRRVAEVAEHVGISEDYLRHLFRRRYGISLVQWLTAARIEQAKRLLVHTDAPLRVIAAKCGFANERYFSTVFQRVIRLTPGTYRATKHILHPVGDAAQLPNGQ